jgi:two-component system nitrogen regulation response regulator GlnG
VGHDALSTAGLGGSLSRGADGSFVSAARSADEEWLKCLETQTRTLLDTGEAEVWDVLSRRFESQLIRTALEVTRGRRIEAAQRLGIGRNTITRKIQELGLED